MPGPSPSPDFQRRRRNAPTFAWRTFLRSDAPTEVPPIGDRYGGGEWHPETVEWWEAVWTSPIAKAYLPIDMHSLRVIASLRDEVVRGSAKASWYAELRQWEERMGLSPMALMKLRWRVVDDEPAQVHSLDAQQRSRARKDRLSGRFDHLRDTQDDDNDNDRPGVHAR